MKHLAPLVLLIILSCKADPIPLKPIQKKQTTKVDLDQDAINELYTYYYSNAQSIPEKEQNAIIDYAVENSIPLRRSPTGLYYWISKEGHGELLRRGEEIEVDYRGYFLNGQEFDSSYKRGQVLRFKVGSMISGWNEVLQYVNIGSQISVFIPSRLAYGEDGFSNSIAPNTPIAFDIEVHKKVDKEAN